MRRASALLLLAAGASLLLGAAKPRLVPDVSENKIEIQYTFTGAELLLFGAILYPGGRVPTERADIVIVVKGPLQPLLVREKQKVAGIWMNVDSARFRSAPSFYAVASSRPLVAARRRARRRHLRARRPESCSYRPGPARASTSSAASRPASST